MNDKLKQSLDGRLGGMRWGERDQAEVFRQIRKKELQNVKHVKRGTGALAIAIALLFVVMGAAFALNQAPQPEDQRVAVQPTDTAILPIFTALYENEYFTLTIDSSTCTASEAAFTGTIRMKNPADTMLSLASHTPPGDAGRTRLPVNLNCGVSTQLPGDMPMACGSLRELDVLNMTADTTVFRMSGEVASLHEDVTFTLWINWTDPADSTAQSGELTWSIAAPEQPGMLLAEYDLVTVWQADYTASNGVARLSIDVLPAKPWYVLNRQEEGKATLTVSAEPLLLYPTFDPQDMLGMVDARDPIAGEMPVTLTQSPDGLRLVAEGPLPAAETLYGYIVLHVYSDAAEAHYDEGFDDHYYEVCVPVVPLEGAVEAAPTATPSPLPQPTATAAPQRPEPTGDCIEENEIVRIYLEDTWTDGFTTEASLRIRTIDANNRLELLPNAKGYPNANTWIVELQNPSDRTLSINSIHMDAATGDILISLIDKDLTDVHQDGLLDLAVTITNELNWQEYVLQLRPVIRVPRQSSPRPLYLLNTSDDVPFVQGGLQNTSRYTYIGVMIPAGQGTAPSAFLLDSRGNALAVGQCCFESGASLKMFPHALFPKECEADGQYYLLVMRMDKNESLPEPLHVQLRYQNAGGSDLIHELQLTTRKP